MESIDFYKYPGEDVLVNYFDCHDAEELAMLEALSTGANLLYLQLHPIDGKFDLTSTSHREMLDASILSFNKADNSGLVSVFNKCIIPIEEYGNLQKQLTSKFLILSEDDIDDDLYERIFGR